MTETRSYPHADGDAREAAAYWDARLRNPDCAAEERAAFEAWRAADDTHAAAFETLQDTLEALRAAAARPELRAMRDAALRRDKWQGVRVAAVAAALVLCAGLGWVAASEGTLNGIAVALGLSERSEVPSADVAKVYATAIGGRSTVTLEDGSRVTLNTQSRLETHFSKGRRDVTLVAGQALFDVAHDTSRPFVVTAGDRKVTAVGTEFDVRLDGQAVRVVLVEGRVKVEARAASGLLSLFSSEQHDLVAGQEYVSNAKPANIVRPADVNQAILWRDGRVAFNDVPLTEAIAEMNRYAPDTVVVADPTMVRLHVNGVFRTGETNAFVHALEEYFPVKAEQQPGGDTLLVWRR
jgi:transmembrane sensor